MKKYNFPKELTEKKQWVNVIKKISYTPYSKEPKLANLYDKEDWGTYEEVVDRIKDKAFNELGFVFSRENNIIVIDIDSGAYDNGILNDFGVWVTNFLSSYTEKSIGHRGTHIFIKANLDINNMSTFSQEHKMELYNSGKMIQMTGDTLIDCPIQERQKELEYLISKYFLEGLKHAEVVEEKDDLIKKYYHPNQEEMTYTQILGGMRKETLLSLCYKSLLTNKSKSDILDIMKKENEKCIPKLSNKEIEEIYELGVNYIKNDN